jgi:hypothetical protein
MLLHGGNALSTYLNDHLAGSTAGVELAGRVAPELQAEIAEDRRALQDVMRRFGAGQDPVKTVAAWGAERVRRLRPGWLLDDARVGRLEELELLTAGVTGKLSLWEALIHTRAGDPRLRDVDLEALAARAQSQLERLRERRESAAAEAFSRLAG